MGKQRKKTPHELPTPVNSIDWNRQVWLLVKAGKISPLCLDSRAPDQRHPINRKKTA